MSLEDLGVGPPPAAGTSELRPIGVPAGYTVTRPEPTTGPVGPFGPLGPGETGTGPVGPYGPVTAEGGPFAPQIGQPQMPRGPTYYDGDQYLPGSLSAEDTARLQRRMLAAGLYNPQEAQNAQLGVWDDYSVAAYERLLSYANRVGLGAPGNPEEALRDYEARGQGQEEMGLQTSPIDIRQLAQQAALARTGQTLSEDQLSAFETAYHRTVDQTPDIGVAPPSPEAFAESQVDTMNPDALAEHAAAQAQNEWFAALASPVGGAA